MPITDHDKIVGGLNDIILSKFKLTKHAFKRCRERHISLEEIQKRKPACTLITNGKKLITAFYQETKPKIIEIVQENPKIMKNSLGYYIAEITSDPQFFPFFAGKQWKNINFLKNMLGCDIIVNDEQKIQIVTENTDHAVFCYYFLESFIENLKNKDFRNFRLGFIPNIDPTKKENTNQLFGNKISLFHFDNCLFFFTSSSVKLLQKLLTHLGKKSSEILFFSNRPGEILEDAVLQEVQKDEDSSDEEIIVQNHDKGKKFMCNVECSPNIIPLIIGSQKKRLLEIKNFLGCKINFRKKYNAFRFIADSHENMMFSIDFFKELIKYLCPENNNGKMGNLVFGKIMIEPSSNQDEKNDEMSIYYRGNELFFCCRKSGLKKLLKKISKTESDIISVENK